MTAIPLAAFIPAFQDDTDVLVNAVRSLIGLEGLREILVCDTGPGFYHENFRAEQQSVRDFCTWAQVEGWPVVYDAGLALRTVPFPGALDAADSLFPV